MNAGRTIAKTAAYSVPRRDLDAVRRAVVEFVAAIEADEPGTLIYIALMEHSPEADDEVGFLHVMFFRDDAGERAHGSTGAVRRFTDVLHPLTVDGVRFTDHMLVATTDRLTER